jgi:CRISPR/Cas system-associated endonuclease Cas1
MDLPSEPPSYLDLVPRDVRKQVAFIIKEEAREEARKRLVEEKIENADRQVGVMDLRDALPMRQEYAEEHRDLDVRRDLLRREYDQLRKAHHGSIEGNASREAWKAEKKRLRNDKPTRMWLREPRKRHVFHPHNVHHLT